MRAAIGLVCLVGLVGLVGCGGSGGRDAGGPGIDANITRTDANAPALDAFVAACSTMGPENTAVACADGCDNDGNSFADCNDFDCCSLVTCGTDTSCGMPRNDAGPRPPLDAAVTTCSTMGPENTVAACGDRCDNDGNGFFDCGDFDCCDLVTCGPTTPCGRLDAGMRPDTGPRCDAGMPGVTESGAAACGDGVDNDCDGFTDCRDFDCSTMAPVDRTYCIENTRALCTDTMDNDSDRFVDCNDRDCCTVLTTTDCAAGSYIGDGRCM